MKRAAGSVLLAAVLAGCGTTVPLAQQQNGGVGTGLGPSQGTGSAASGTTGLPTAGGTGGLGSAGSTGTAITAGAGAGTAGSGTGSASLPTSVTADGSHTPIKVGVVAVNYAAFAATFGVSNVNSTVFGTYQSIFAALNKQGGMSGHRIQATYDEVDGGASSADAEAQRSCAKFAEDAKVAVVLSYNYISETFSSCLAKSRIPQMDSGFFAMGDKAMARHPNLFVPDGMSMDRYMRNLLDTSVALGRLTTKDTLGVLREDCPMHNEVDAGTVQPEAKRLGIKVVESTINCYQGFSQIGNASSQISAAVLKFRSAGVTHMTCMSASEGFCMVIFTKAASDQGYHPKYLMTSNAFPNSDSDTSQPVSYTKDQLPGMTAIGWSPLIDVGSRTRTATPDQAKAQAFCHKLDPTYGGHASDSLARDNQIAFAYGQCDSILVLKAIVARVGTQLSMTTAFPPGYAAAAPTYSPAQPTGGALSFAGGRRDGATFIMATSWKSSCSCFSADGPLRKVS